MVQIRLMKAAFTSNTTPKGSLDSLTHLRARSIRRGIGAEARTGAEPVLVSFTRAQADGSIGDSMTHFVVRFAKDSAGATAIEYALIAASISIVIVTAAQLLGTKLTTIFASVAGAF